MEVRDEISIEVDIAVVVPNDVIRWSKAIVGFEAMQDVVECFWVAIPVHDLPMNKGGTGAYKSTSTPTISSPHFDI
ncbi:hypothetical protein [Burkholderia sp. WAC0059]|uniref:hypothetical protein n=1 Tax=Burkholderia sp. WAC0059 TaxID=2066022 RepID=UPI0011AEF334|nr:hypothetical protein [Burkholderia sp. WAC0059]